jgi:hypothetical protein
MSEAKHGVDWWNDGLGWYSEVSRFESKPVCSSVLTDVFRGVMCNSVRFYNRVASSIG